MDEFQPNREQRRAMKKPKGQRRLAELEKASAGIRNATESLRKKIAEAEKRA
jgi:hypothetical protein